MFGRRTTGFGTKMPSPPPPPPTDAWPPFQKMDGALDAAIRLFTRSLDDAGHDCASLAIRGTVPPSVSKLLADCVVYQDEKGAGYLTLGLTRDMQAFSYQPHCRLFLILNGALLMEDPISSELRSDIAIHHLPSPLLDAHMMKRWIKYIRAVGNDMADNKGNGLGELITKLRAELDEVARLTPGWISQRIDVGACAEEWASGFPGTIGRPLSSDVKRLNDLPVSDFVHQLLLDYLANVQMQGMREQRHASG